MDKIYVQAYLTEKKLEQVVDEAIEDFDRAFQSLGNDPLVRGEKAILKTFLGYRLGLMKGAAAGPEGPAQDQ